MANLSLEDKLLKQSIDVPLPPWLEELKEFGTAEGAALITNVGGTAFLEYLLPHFGVTSDALRTTLTFAGPIIEKVGFLAKPGIRAWRNYQTTEESERKEISAYVKTAFAGAGSDLLKDVCVHDPLYCAMMYEGQKHTSLSATALSLASFVIAVGIVATGTVAYNEIKHSLTRKKLIKNGFQKEEYFESRFYMPAKNNPSEVYQTLTEHFKLPIKSTDEYHDLYFENTLPQLSGRTAKLRLREHAFQHSHTDHSAQIVFTRAKKTHTQNGLAPCFPVRKEKFYRKLDTETFPEKITELPEDKSKKILCSYTAKENEPPKKVAFTRHIARDPHGLLLTVDEVVGKNPFYVIELKVHEDTTLLARAMRHLMSNYNPIQTTYSKLELVGMNGN